MLPMNNISAIFDFTDNMRFAIKSGIEAGLEDSKAGRMSELTDDYVKNLKAELKRRIQYKNS